MIKKLFYGILTLVLIPIALSAWWEWIHRTEPDKIVGSLPYANDYFFANGKTYKGASTLPIENMERPIDPEDPIPLKFGSPDYKLTLGIRNRNSNQLTNVYLFLFIPTEVHVTKFDGWAKNSETEYYTFLGTINPDMLVRDPLPIYLAFDKPGLYGLAYNISGNFPVIRNKRLNINVYE